MVEGMRLKLGQRQSDWRCCFCCHVRTGTIALGIWHLLLHVMALSMIAVVLRHPEAMDDDQMYQMSRDPVLPTPLSEVEERGQGHQLQYSGIADYPDPRNNDFRSPSSRFASEARFVHRQDYNYQSLNVGVVVTFCTFLITLLMVFGAVKGKPSYLMPFFCLQVFDFCIASLSAVGYLCYPQDVRRLVERSPYVPFKEVLLQMNRHCLHWLVVCGFMVVMAIKAYFIHVVWACYRYLTLRQAAQQCNISCIDQVSQNLLNEPPDYDTAVRDPRFQIPDAAKKFPPPPPSYATVAANYPTVTLDVEFGPSQSPPAPGFVSATNSTTVASVVPPSSNSGLTGQNA